MFVHTTDRKTDSSFFVIWY